MKDIAFLIIICLFVFHAHSQVGIGTAHPDSSTLLHVDDGSGTKGILIPKVQIDDVTTAAPLTTTPQLGTLVFNDNGPNSPGFYYWDATKWVQLISNDTDETIYTKNGTLSEDRTVNMDGNELLFSNSAGRTLKLIPADPADINAPFTFQTNNSYNFVTDAKDALTIDNSGRVGVDRIDPIMPLHVGGATGTIRVDGLNTTNNSNNIAADPVPVYVNNDGDLVTQPPLIQSFMLLNLRDFTNEVVITSNDGSSQDIDLNTSSITLTQRSLVHYSYQFSVVITRADGTALTDGASRLFRAWFTVDGDNTNHYGYNTGTYTNNPDVNNASGTYASGFYYLNGSGYVELDAGTHNITLTARGFGAGFDFRMRFGTTTYDSIQAVVHR
ncbi:hypothetical protein [Nonlabens agnitus]|uniref:Uncharacterized protein n=1 Tax=Nonlabens agnitus TaxID=870484 RepID=A0A2S9WUC0_9FLAO|nr:hypothetical protein [Nonlabens agnitus]PRP67054.1 hypothetical protein BST86_08040 [Nonlabens agnitus]